MKQLEIDFSHASPEEKLEQLEQKIDNLDQRFDRLEVLLYDILSRINLVKGNE